MVQHSAVYEKKKRGGRDIFFILVGYVATSQDVCPFAFPRVKKKKGKEKEREREVWDVYRGRPFSPALDIKSLPLAYRVA